MGWPLLARDGSGTIVDVPELTQPSLDLASWHLVSPPVLLQVGRSKSRTSN